MNCLSVLTLFLFLHIHTPCRAKAPTCGAEEDSCQGTIAETRSSSLLQAKKNGNTQSPEVFFASIHSVTDSFCTGEEQHIIPMSDATQTLNDLVLEPGSKKLGFIHIAHNAGKAVERAGLKAGVRWGFNAINHTYIQKLQLTEDRMCTWNLVPPRFLQGVELYADGPLFCVVRDPVERFFAAYLFFMEMASHHCPVSQHDYDLLNWYEWCTPQSLNYFTMEALRRVSERLFDFDCNLIPQATYIWDWDGNQVCNDILQFKDLKQEFNQLMDKYAMDVTLAEADRGEVQGARICPALSLADFDDNSTLALRQFYAVDFQALGFQ